MKIRVLLLEKDKNYLKKIMAVLSKKYPDKLQIYAATDEDALLSVLKNNKVDILLSNENFDIDIKILPKRCGFAYLTESNDIDAWKDSATIGKYQKIDLIYREILNIYAEKASDMGMARFSQDDMPDIFTFVSAGGGSGSSTLSAATAIRAVNMGRKTLYLNLEKFGNTDHFFYAEGNGNLSEALYAIKSKKTNTLIKLESNLKVSSNGVNFFESCKNSFDIMELEGNDIKLLISELSKGKLFDCIIIDCDFDFSERMLEVFKLSSMIYFVNDGSEVGNSKFMKAYNTMEIYEQHKDVRLLDRISLIYNKFRNKTSTMIENSDIKVVGGIKMYDGAKTEQIIAELVRMDLLDNLLA